MKVIKLEIGIGLRLMLLLQKQPVQRSVHLLIPIQKTKHKTKNQLHSGSISAEIQGEQIGETEKSYRVGMDK